MERTQALETLKQFKELTQLRHPNPNKHLNCGHL